mmetsp:Transcript_26691/g.58116  ORF Transcript_26691/g.58116 Transcript_26691/m.58116 type:complete len:215 (+) Transcript_26691:175-819(+)
MGDVCQCGEQLTAIGDRPCARMRPMSAGARSPAILRPSPPSHLGEVVPLPPVDVRLQRSLEVGVVDRAPRAAAPPPTRALVHRLLAVRREHLGQRGQRLPGEQHPPERLPAAGPPGLPDPHLVGGAPHAQRQQRRARRQPHVLPAREGLPVVLPGVDEAHERGDGVELHYLLLVGSAVHGQAVQQRRRLRRLPACCACCYKRCVRDGIPTWLAA